MSEIQIQINVPASVWYDYLDPLATDMERDLGLADLAPTTTKRGRGFTVHYHRVPESIARDLMQYLDDRAWTLLGQYGEERAVHYRAREVAARIRSALSS